MTEKSDPEIEVNLEVEFRGSVNVFMKLSEAKELARKVEAGEMPEFDADRFNFVFDENDFVTEVQDLDFEEPNAEKSD